MQLPFLLMSQRIPAKCRTAGISKFDGPKEVHIVQPTTSYVLCRCLIKLHIFSCRIKVYSGPWLSPLPTCGLYRLAQLHCITVALLDVEVPVLKTFFATGEMSYINLFPIAYILDHRSSLITYGSSKMRFSSKQRPAPTTHYRTHELRFSGEFTVSQMHVPHLILNITAAQLKPESLQGLNAESSYILVQVSIVSRRASAGNVAQESSEFSTTILDCLNLNREWW